MMNDPGVKRSHGRRILRLMLIVLCFCHLGVFMQVVNGAVFRPDAWHLRALGGMPASFHLDFLF